MPKSPKLSLTQEEKQAAFEDLATTYKRCLAAGEHIAAHVLAFSFLEDRITAMDAVRHARAGLKYDKHRAFSVMLEALAYAGDLTSEEVQQFKAVAKVRNGLIHQAMWNQKRFTAAKAAEVFRFARMADRCRRRQKKMLGQ
ncbi:MAG: hypothetical protein KJ015_09955 [Myxococcales bacterium]|nr:hypothetical protein [Myxococcales bacterium]